MMADIGDEEKIQADELEKDEITTKSDMNVDRAVFLNIR